MPPRSRRLAHHFSSDKREADRGAFGVAKSGRKGDGEKGLSSSTFSSAKDKFLACVRVALSLMLGSLGVAGY